jgi:hypothetical protein
MEWMLCEEKRFFHLISNVKNEYGPKEGFLFCGIHPYWELLVFPRVPNPLAITHIRSVESVELNRSQKTIGDQHV